MYEPPPNVRSTIPAFVAGFQRRPSAAVEGLLYHLADIIDVEHIDAAAIEDFIIANDAFLAVMEAMVEIYNAPDDELAARRARKRE